jgi:hypothetical protein
VAALHDGRAGGSGADDRGALRGARRVAEAFAGAYATSVGRWRRDLGAEQLADVEAEAGSLLRELGYG